MLCSVTMPDFCDVTTKDYMDHMTLLISNDCMRSLTSVHREAVMFSGRHRIRSVNPISSEKLGILLILEVCYVLRFDHVRDDAGSRGTRGRFTFLSPPNDKRHFSRALAVGSSAFRYSPQPSPPRAFRPCHGRRIEIGRPRWLWLVLH